MSEALTTSYGYGTVPNVSTTSADGTGTFTVLFSSLVDFCALFSFVFPRFSVFVYFRIV